MHQSEVYARSEPRFNMCGQVLPNTVKLTVQTISSGLCDRLIKYATSRMNDAGLNIVTSWNCVVSTLDHDEKPADRFYCVNWTNDKGTRISLEGILTKNGWPSLDHGIHIAENQ